MVDDRIKNIKIAVHSEEESRQAQEKLFELGANWLDGLKSVKHMSSSYLFVYKCLGKWVITRAFNDKKYFDKAPEKEIYFEDLMAMKVKKEDDWNWRINCRQHLGDIECMRTVKEKIVKDAKEEFIHFNDVIKLQTILKKRMGDLK